MEGALELTDPLQEHLGAEFSVPEKDGRTLRLIDLITQASGLPREVPGQTGGTADDPFAGNTVQAQIDALKGDPYLFPPGTGVLYSNYGHDLLGAALAHVAGKPYAELLAERVLTPRGMTDTVLNLREGDQDRAMQGHGFDGVADAVGPLAGDDRVRGRALLDRQRHAEVDGVASRPRRR